VGRVPAPGCAAWATVRLLDVIVAPVQYHAGCASTCGADDHPIESVPCRPVPMWVIEYDTLSAPERSGVCREVLVDLTIDDAGRRRSASRGVSG